MENFETLFDVDLGIGSMIVDADGIIVDAGPVASKIFGFEHGELIGVSVESLIPESKREQHITDRHQYMENPIPRKMGTGREVIALRKDGTEVPIEAALDYYEGYVCMTIVDITLRKKQQSALVEKIELLREKIKTIGIKI